MRAEGVAPQYFLYFIPKLHNLPLLGETAQKYPSWWSCTFAELTKQARVHTTQASQNHHSLGKAFFVVSLRIPATHYFFFLIFTFIPSNRNTYFS